MKNATQKVAPKFTCKNCYYSTSKKSSWLKHIDTRNHKEQQMLQNATQKVALKDFSCENCGKIYKHSSSLYRHKKKCNLNHKIEKTENQIEDQNENQTKSFIKNITEEPEPTYVNQATPDIAKELNEVKEMLSMMAESQQYTQNELKELKHNAGSTTNNNMTINVYLNEHCKNAMNINDFLKQLHISMDDLYYTKENGYVKGISNIFMKSLNTLEPTQRPIHCSDKKRLQFYIKDEDKWEKDKNNKIDESINFIKNKQIKQIKEWESLHPNWTQNDEETQMYIQMIQHVMGGSNDEIIEENAKNIKKHLGYTFDIKDIKNINI